MAEPGIEGLHHRVATGVHPVGKIVAGTRAVAERHRAIIREVLDKEVELRLPSAVIERREAFDDLLVDRRARLAVGEAEEGQEVCVVWKGCGRVGDTIRDGFDVRAAACNRDGCECRC